MSQKNCMEHVVGGPDDIMPSGKSAAVEAPEYWTTSIKVMCPECEGRKGTPPDSPCGFCDAAGVVEETVEVCRLSSYEELSVRLVRQFEREAAVWENSERADNRAERERLRAERNMDTLIDLVRRLPL